MWRYYSTERPLTPGAIPRQREAVEVVNYDEQRRLVWMDDDSADQVRAWGYAEYRERLTPKEVEQYELLEVERYE